VNSNQDQLDNVKQSFDEWRISRPKMGKIPNYLWDMVKPLMDEYPIAIISRALGLSYAQLRQNAIEQPVNFVEVTTSSAKSEHTPIAEPSDTSHRCDIELKRPCGSVLKISSLPISVVTTLIPSFVGN